MIITGNGTMQRAMQAVQPGAYECLTNPPKVASPRVGPRTVTRRIPRPAPLQPHELNGKSPRMQELYKLIGSISATPNHAPLPNVGESGTGNERVARPIHANAASAAG